jgi:hypothetical protein
MKTIGISRLILCVLLLAGVANAQIVTREYTADYRDNVWGLYGPWFIEPDLVLDHSPFYRNAWEDWGWLHSIAGRVPAGATEIESATLRIVAWGVAPPAWLDSPLFGQPRWASEEHMIYVHPQPYQSQMGLLKTFEDSPIQVPWAAVDPQTGDGQPSGYESRFSITEFELPANVIDHLWTTGQVYFSMDIDRIMDADAGKRVTLVSATLRIRYVAPGAVIEPDIDVHRFWSPVTGGHFYTTDEDEAAHIIATYWHTWTYEGVAYRTLADDSDPAALPVHRFWSPVSGNHFWTMNEDEVDNVIATYSDTWTYEGIVFYAYPPNFQPADAYPVYRFWSNVTGRHFYTIDEVEMLSVIEHYSHEWIYEGIAWNAFASNP